MIRMDVNAATFGRAIQRTHRKMVYAMKLTLDEVARMHGEEMGKQVKKTYDTTRTWWLPQQPTGFKNRKAKMSELKSTSFTGKDNQFLEKHEANQPHKPQGPNGLVIPLYQSSGRNLGKGEKKWAGIKVPTWQKAKGLSTMVRKAGRYIKEGEKALGVYGRYPLIITKDYPDGKTIYFRKKSKKDKLEAMFIVQPSPTRPMGKTLRMHEIAQKLVTERAGRLFLVQIRRISRMS
jgi:hypothetical protein